MMLQQSGFPGCCGAVIIHDFGNTATTGGRNRGTISIKETEIELKRHLQQAPRKAFRVVTLNEPQHKRLHKMMLRNKFKLVSQSYHPNHTHENYLYVRVYEETKKDTYGQIHGYLFYVR